MNHLTENKLILLFVLKNVDMPLTNVQITEIIMKEAIMNYFDLQQYLSELVHTRHIKIFEKEGKQLYDITPTGRETLAYFENRIDYSTKENIMKAIVIKKRDFKKSREIVCDYVPRNENEYVVECKIIENDAPLIDVRLTVGTKAQAKTMCEYWKKNPQHIYMQIISAFTEQDT